MNVLFHKHFEKKYTKLPKNTKHKIKERIDLFMRDPYDPLLNNHALKGIYTGYRSINVSSDVRIIYKLLKTDTVLFTTIGTHSELYK